MSEKTYEVSYHIINKAKVQAKTREEAAEFDSNMAEETLLDGSTLSIQHIWEPDVDTATETELAERGVRLSPSYKLSMEDEPPIQETSSTDKDFPLGSL